MLVCEKGGGGQMAAENVRTEEWHLSYVDVVLLPSNVVWHPWKSTKNEQVRVNAHESPWCVGASKRWHLNWLGGT